MRNAKCEMRKSTPAAAVGVDSSACTAGFQIANCRFPLPTRQSQSLSFRVLQGPFGPTERGNNLGNSDSFAILGNPRISKKTRHIASDQHFSYLEVRPRRGQRGIWSISTPARLSPDRIVLVVSPPPRCAGWKPAPQFGPANRVRESAGEIVVQPSWLHSRTLLVTR